MTKIKGPFECVCKSCGIIFEAPRHRRWCDAPVCQHAMLLFGRRFRKVKDKEVRRKRHKEYKERQQPYDNRSRTAGRSWSPGCVLNLWNDYCDGKTVEQTARDTNRWEADVLAMLNRILLEGYEAVYREKEEQYFQEASGHR